MCTRYHHTLFLLIFGHRFDKDSFLKSPSDNIVVTLTHICSHVCLASEVVLIFQRSLVAVEPLHATLTISNTSTQVGSRCCCSRKTKLPEFLLGMARLGARGKTQSCRGRVCSNVLAHLTPLSNQIWCSSMGLKLFQHLY
jgi:hypothetical protein